MGEVLSFSKNLDIRVGGPRQTKTSDMKTLEFFHIFVEKAEKLEFFEILRGRGPHATPGIRS